MVGRRVRLAAVAGALALLATACWKPELTVTYSFGVQSDIVYGQGEVDNGGVFQDMLLDLYVPNVPGQTIFPLAVVIHGGSFLNHDKTQPRIVKWAEELAGRGYIVASIDYRLAGDKPVPSSRVQPIYDAVGGSSASNQTRAAVAAIDDTIAAVEYLHSRPEISNYNTVLIGNSSGSVAALYVGYALDDYGIAGLPIAAVVDTWGGFGWANTPGDAATFIDAFLEPQLFIIHGTDDQTVPYWHAQEIVDQADIVGLPYVLFANEGAGHGFDLFTTEFSPGVPVFQAGVNWLDSILIGVPGPAATTTPPTVP